MSTCCPVPGPAHLGFVQPGQVRTLPQGFVSLAFPTWAPRADPSLYSIPDSQNQEMIGDSLFFWQITLRINTPALPFGFLPGTSALFKKKNK